MNKMSVKLQGITFIVFLGVLNLTMNTHATILKEEIILKYDILINLVVNITSHLSEKSQPDIFQIFKEYKKALDLEKYFIWLGVSDDDNGSLLLNKLHISLLNYIQLFSIKLKECQEKKNLELERIVKEIEEFNLREVGTGS